MKKKRSMHILIGSMLFGLFFGAGNLIVPVFMGQQAGNQLLPATLGFLLTATGLPFLGVMAIGFTGSKNVLELGSRVNRSFGYLLTILLYLTIGPLFALPRTATVAFEVGLTPIIAEDKARLALAVFTILFFSVALYFALRPARILDWVGKFLNPIFLVFISFLFIKALLSPMSSVSSMTAVGNYSTGAFPEGFIQGYQTMDALAALAFGSIVIEEIQRQGITEKREVVLSTLRSGLVAVVLMCLIYGGLAWIGSTSLGVLEPSANGGLILSAISRHYLGELGRIFLAVTITVACLKTAIGLITSCARAFMDMFPNSFSYPVYAVIFAGFSCLVANVGLTQIIALAMPMLMFLYPLATVLIILSFFENFFHKRKEVYLATMIGATLISIVDGLNAMPDIISKTPFVTSLVDFFRATFPLFEYGFGWILPACVGLIIGLIIIRVRPEPAS